MQVQAFLLIRRLMEFLFFAELILEFQFLILVEQILIS